MSGSRKRDLQRKFKALVPIPGGDRWRSFKRAFVRNETFTWVGYQAPYAKDVPQYMRPGRAARP